MYPVIDNTKIPTITKVVKKTASVELPPLLLVEGGYGNTMYSFTNSPLVV